MSNNNGGRTLEPELNPYDNRPSHEPPPLRVYRLQGTDCVIAESEAEAWALWAGSLGETLDGYDLSEVEVLPDDKRWAITFEDPSDAPAGLTDPKQPQSAADWVRLCGKGFLCSTEF